MSRINSSISYWLAFWVAAPLLLIAMPVFSNAEPDILPFTATYSAKYNGIKLNTRRTLGIQADGTHVIQTRSSNLMGKIGEISTFKLNDAGKIRVDQYRYYRSIFGIKKTETIDFDWQNNIAIYSSKKHKRQVDLNEEPLDKATYQLQLQRDMKAGKTEMHYPVVDRGKLRTYHFRVIGNEIVGTRLGEVLAVKLQRIRKTDERETFIWLSPQWGYLLVKLQQREEDGETYQLHLESANINGKKIAIASTAT